MGNPKIANGLNFAELPVVLTPRWPPDVDRPLGIKEFCFHRIHQLEKN